jgi:hypothetical protein
VEYPGIELLKVISIFISFASFTGKYRSRQKNINIESRL